MKRRKAGMLLGFIVATLVLAVGYALVTDINLSVSGTASAGASNENFKVQFDANSMKTDGTTNNVTVSNKQTDVSENGQQLNVGFTATGFTAKGDTAVVTYTIKNDSNDLNALLSSTGVEITVPSSTGSVTYYENGASLFEKDYYFTSTKDTKTTTVSSVADSNTTTVTVVITLKETILNEENVMVNINLPITATAQ